MASEYDQLTGTTPTRIRARLLSTAETLLLSEQTVEFLPGQPGRCALVYLAGVSECPSKWP